MTFSKNFLRCAAGTILGLVLIFSALLFNPALAKSESLPGTYENFGLNFDTKTVYVGIGTESEISDDTNQNSSVLPISYSVLFSTDGGSEVEKQTLQVGNKAYRPTDPTKEGYIFVGWYTDRELNHEYDFDTVIETSFVLYAKWEEIIIQEVETWQNPYTDINSNDWFYTSVEFVVSRGLFYGTTATTFSPQETMTRAMFVTVLARLAGQETAGGENWYDLALDWALKEELTDGSRLQSAITREQIVTILWRYSNQPKSTGTVSSYADYNEISEWALEASEWALEAGIISATNGSFNPQGLATRGEIAVILQRFMQNP